MVMQECHSGHLVHGSQTVHSQPTIDLARLLPLQSQPYSETSHKTLQMTVLPDEQHCQAPQQNPLQRGIASAYPNLGSVIDILNVSVLIVSRYNFNCCILLCPTWLDFGWIRMCVYSLGLHACYTYRSTLMVFHPFQRLFSLFSVLGDLGLLEMFD